MKRQVVILLLTAISVNSLLFTACGNKDVSVSAMGNNVISDVETESSITEESSSVDTEESISTEVETESITESITESSVATENNTEESSNIETEAGTGGSVETKNSVETSIRQEEINNVGETNFTTTPLDITMYATQQCNIRKGPSTDNDIIGTLSQAEEIHITGRVDDLNWYELSLSDGSTEYVSGKLLTDTKPTVQVEASNPTTQQEAVSQSDNTSHSNEVINELTGEPLKPGDEVVGGLIYLGETQYTENGDIVLPDGTIAHRVNK